MSDQTPDDLIKCRYCGRMTSSKANFCYYCARELETRPERPAERPGAVPSSWLVYAAAGVVLLGLVIYLIFRIFS